MLNVLVVDDSMVMHSLYEMLLKRITECNVVHAMNGQEGLDLLKKNRNCQLIILDVNMPVMGGLEFLKKYRSTKGNTTPVIIVSTEGDDEEVQRGLDSGATAYLKKPVSPEDLQTILCNVLGLLKN